MPIYINNFLPLVLINQFKAAFNSFFLICVIIAFIPVLNYKWVVRDVGPFVRVIFISLMKEVIEDYRKYSYDKKLL